MTFSSKTCLRRDRHSKNVTFWKRPQPLISFSKRAEDWIKPYITPFCNVLFRVQGVLVIPYQCRVENCSEHCKSFWRCNCLFLSVDIRTLNLTETFPLTLLKAFPYNMSFQKRYKLMTSNTFAFSFQNVLWRLYETTAWGRFYNVYNSC